MGGGNQRVYVWRRDLCLGVIGKPTVDGMPPRCPCGLRLFIFLDTLGWMRLHSVEEVVYGDDDLLVTLVRVTPD